MCVEAIALLIFGACSNIMFVIVNVKFYAFTKDGIGSLSHVDFVYT